MSLIEIKLKLNKLVQIELETNYELRNLKSNRTHTNICNPLMSDSTKIKKIM